MKCQPLAVYLRGNEMKRKIHLMRTASFPTIALLVLTLFTAFYTPKALAEVSITQISPAQGPVGTVVTVTGQITTQNGSYKVFFADREVQNGTATQTDVSTTFPVPNSTWGKQLIKLHDVTANESSTFEEIRVQTKYIIEAWWGQAPQAQEGENITILASITGGNDTTPSMVNITVTDPANTPHSVMNVNVSIDPNYGNGTANRIYPTEFNQPTSPHTHYVGSYEMKLNVADETKATGTFTIGLTNATEYHRFQTVFIQAANYTTSDLLTVRVTHISETFNLPPSNASGPLGIVTANWTIPANASLGSYMVEVEAKPPGFEKTVPDTQNITIVSKSFLCEVRTLNLEGETVEGMLVEAWNATSPPIVSSNTTNEDGAALLDLTANDYNFRAFWNASDGPKAEVGRTPWTSVGAAPGDRVGIHAINITCSLVHIKVAVADSEGAPIPFVNLSIAFTYTSRLDVLITPTPLSSETALGGDAVFRNVYTNVNYTIKASRYDRVFATVVSSLTSTRWFNLTCPAYRLIIRVYDRNGAAFQGAQVEVHEWSMGLSGLVGTEPTDSSGEAAFNSTFGKYSVDVYKNDMLVNHTVALLTNPVTEFPVYCKLYSLTLEVNVVDYFGLGIPNANVTIEREGAVLASSNTGANGVAPFIDLIGGNYRILVYIGGNPYDITTIYLQEPQSISIKISDLVSIGGFTTETSYLLTAALIILLGIAVLSVFLYRRLKTRQKME
jgi:hypothetical protein